jgi:hypothetical protein
MPRRYSWFAMQRTANTRHQTALHHAQSSSAEALQSLMSKASLYSAIERDIEEYISRSKALQGQGAARTHFFPDVLAEILN